MLASVFSFLTVTGSAAGVWLLPNSLSIRVLLIVVFSLIVRLTRPAAGLELR